MAESDKSDSSAGDTQGLLLLLQISRMNDYCLTFLSKMKDLQCLSIGKQAYGGWGGSVII